MAQHAFVIEDRENPIGTPRFVLVELNDPLIGTNTWEIRMPNTWIGTGSGEYEVDGREVELRDGKFENERTRLVLHDIDYPSDLTSSGGTVKTGTAQYVSEARQVSGALAEWSGRNIAPDEF